MWRINKVKTEDNASTFTIENEFGLYYDHEELKTYSDIENKFKNFKIDEEFENELIEEQCKSLTNYRFFLSNGKEDIYLFLINLEVCSSTELIYEYYFSSIDDNLDNIQNLDAENYFLKIKSSSKFLKFVPFENEDEDEDEDDEEELYMIPAIIENSFSSDNCIICLKIKPNILNFPCLHLSLCEECEKIGRFINCSICRKEIKRKVKI